MGNLVGKFASDHWFLCMAGKPRISFECAVMSVKVRKAHRTICDVRDGPEDRTTEGHSVDALAPGGDEGRGTLRKVLGNREQVLIQEYPNGATPSQEDRNLNT